MTDYTVCTPLALLDCFRERHALPTEERHRVLQAVWDRFGEDEARHLMLADIEELRERAMALETV